MAIATQTLTYLDIKATAARWAAEYGLEDDDMWTHPFTNVRMTISLVLWSLYTERHMSLEGMKCHFDRHGIFALQARKEAEEAERIQANTDEHTDNCNAYRTRQQQKRDAWIALYPAYCRACGGNGGRQYDGSLYEPPVFVSCEFCADKGVCPRCGACGTNPDAWLTDKPLCPVCGYIGCGTDHVPFVPECYCLLDRCADDPLGMLEDCPF